MCKWVWKPLQGVLGQKGNRSVVGMQEGWGRLGAAGGGARPVPPPGTVLQATQWQSGTQ